MEPLYPIGKAGVAVAFGIIGALFIFANIMIIWDEASRNMKFNKDIADAREEVKKHKLNPQ